MENGQNHTGSNDFQEYVNTANLAALPSVLKNTDARSVSDLCYNNLYLNGNNEFTLLNFIIQYAARSKKSALVKYDDLLSAILARSKVTNESKIKELLDLIIGRMEEKNICLRQKETGDFVFINSQFIKNDQANINTDKDTPDITRKLNNYYSQFENNKWHLLEFPDEKSFQIDKARFIHEMPADMHKKTVLQNPAWPDNFVIKIMFRNETSILTPAAYMLSLFDASIAMIRHALTNDDTKDVATATLTRLNEIMQLRKRPKWELSQFRDFVTRIQMDDPFAEGLTEWIDICNHLVETYSQKSEYSDLYHAGSLAGFYLPEVLEEGRQRKIELERRLKDKIYLEEKLREEPGFFSIKDMQNLPDSDQKTTLGAKYKGQAFKEFLGMFLEQYNALPDEKKGKDIPEIIDYPFRRKILFIHREQIVSYLLNRAQEINKKFKDTYTLPWAADLKNIIPNPDQQSDQSYDDLLHEFIYAKFPLEFGILKHPNLLLYARAYTSKSHDNKVAQWFDSKGKINLPQVIGLSRLDMLKEAKTMLLFPWNFIFARRLRKLTLKVLGLSGPKGSRAQDHSALNNPIDPKASDKKTAGQNTNQDLTQKKPASFNHQFGHISSKSLNQYLDFIMGPDPASTKKQDSLPRSQSKKSPGFDQNIAQDNGIPEESNATTKTHDKNLSSVSQQTDADSDHSFNIGSNPASDNSSNQDPYQQGNTPQENSIEEELYDMDELTNIEKKQDKEVAAKKNKWEAEREKKNRKQAVDLKQKIIGKEPAQKQMQKLEEEWNPTFGKKNRQETKDNIDAAIETSIRKIYSINQIPLSHERIQDLAKSISQDQAFARVRNKKAFQKYIALIMMENIIGPHYDI